jgi:hypothetical protein
MSKKLLYGKRVYRCHWIVVDRTDGMAISDKDGRLFAFNSRAKARAFADQSRRDGCTTETVRHLVLDVRGAR